jgi:hypothetical protein
VKGLLVLVLVSVAAIASANGVMGYALEQYDFHAWLVYVIGTIVFEAWAIGRWAGKSWPAAVGISIVANLVTAGCCANLCGVGLHSTFVGSRINPNPLANMLVMFTVFGVISGLVESVVWSIATRRNESKFAVRSLLAHLVWVPLGMAIMLVPSRPYPMLEAYTVYARHFHVQTVARLISNEIYESSRIPDHHDTARLFQELIPADGSNTEDAWAVAYRPDFSRFSIGQTKGELFWEWNTAATKLKVDSPKMPEQIWLLRPKKRESRYPFGLVWNGSEVKLVRNDTQLGY